MWRQECSYPQVFYPVSSMVLSPPDKMEELARYANKHGRKTDKPYFSLDGKTCFSASQWARIRPKCNHVHGVTNVWREPAVRGRERIRRKGLKSLHANQKSLTLMERITNTSTEVGDVIWEPFGGLCSDTVTALRTGISCYADEVLPDYFDVATARINREHRERSIYERTYNFGSPG